MGTGQDQNLAAQTGEDTHLHHNALPARASAQDAFHEPHELERAHLLGAPAAEWARDLRQPGGETTVEKSGAAQTQPHPESVLQYLYRGNKVGFGLATVATGISVAACSLVAWALSANGASPLESATAAAATSYIWYPANMLLNHIFRDRHIIQQRAEQGDTGARGRTWGSRLTQLVLAEGFWIGVFIPAQYALVTTAGLSSGVASAIAHVPIGMAINFALITPIRNLSQWLWRLDGPRRGA